MRTPRIAAPTIPTFKKPDLSNSDTPNGAPQPGVFHHKAETITTDTEKAIAAYGPLIEKAAPLIAAWRGPETENLKVTESAATKRQGFITSLVLIVGCVCGPAWISIANGQAAIAEKIVIGLLAFLGGIGARR